MESVIQWVKNMVYYLIFIGLVFSLLPNGKYERYIRLFSGAVFLLIVISPITGGLNLDERLAYAYERIRFKQDTGEFEEKLWGIEDRQIEQVIRQYEEAVSRNIQAMAAADGIGCRKARVSIGKQEGEEDFGQITGIELVLDGGGGETVSGSGFRVWEDGDGAVIMAGKAPEEIAPVTIQVEEALAQKNQEPGGQADKREAEGGGKEDGGIENSKGEDKEKRQAEDRQEELYGFQRKVAEYYGLEEKNIRITWENEEGELDPSAVRRADFDDSGSAR